MSTKSVVPQDWKPLDAVCVTRELECREDVSEQFPQRWRVFGCVCAEFAKIHVASRGIRCELLAHAAVDQLDAIPQTLAIGEATFAGKDVALCDGTLDFDALFGGHDKTPGYQAYAMAEVEFTQPTEVTLGTGGDYWMQWWIDGQEVLNNLDKGNARGRVGPADQRIKHRFEAGRHLIVLRSVSGGAGNWHVQLGFINAKEELLATRDPNAWEIVPELDLIHPPYDNSDGRLAIQTNGGWSQETITCTFTSDAGNGQFGLVFGAKDHANFHWAYVSRWSQNFRARAVYAAIARFDGQGYPQTLAMVLVPNVEMHINTPITLRVERRDGWIRLNVNGVRGPEVRDEINGPGHVGLLGSGEYTASGFCIEGESEPDAPWTDNVQPRQLWTSPFEVPDDASPVGYCGVTRLSNGDIVTSVWGYQLPDSASTDDPRAVPVLSKDGGRSWIARGRSDELLDGLYFEHKPGVMRKLKIGPALSGARLGFASCQADEFITVQDSQDQGLTWTEPEVAAIAGDWSEVFIEGFTLSVGTYERFDDGSLIMVLIRQCPGFFDRIPQQGQGTWATRLAQPYTIRSDDGSLTWQSPVPMDNAATYDGETPDSPCCDFTEMSLGQLPTGKIIALGRPFSSPFAWFTESDDGGRSWGVARYLPFSISGNPQLVATRSGHLVVVGRGIGGTALHVSIDGGLNWDYSAILDHYCGYNGFMIEAEPDVVLVLYAVVKSVPQDTTPAMLRAHRVRITQQGPVPADDE